MGEFRSLLLRFVLTLSNTVPCGVALSASAHQH